MWGPAICGFALTGLLLSAPALNGVPNPTAPKIDHIEIAGNLATIHFGTEAGRAYALQARDGFHAAEWKVIYTIRALPFSNHYVIADSLTNQFRFYRLSATP